MKVEPRGKFGGVKLHLEPEEAEVLLGLVEAGKVSSFSELKGAPQAMTASFSLAHLMGKKIKLLLQEHPTLLKERTKEEILAILAKEAEKSALQLKLAEAGQDITKVNKEALKEALLKHVKE